MATCEVRPPESAARPSTLRRSMEIRSEGRRVWATTMHSSSNPDSAGRRGLASWPRIRSATSWMSLERSRRYSSPLSASLAARAATTCCSTTSVFFFRSASPCSTCSLNSGSPSIRICDSSRRSSGSPGPVRPRRSSSSRTALSRAPRKRASSRGRSSAGTS